MHSKFQHVIFALKTKKTTVQINSVLFNRIRGLILSFTYIFNFFITLIIVKCLYWSLVNNFSHFSWNFFSLLFFLPKVGNPAKLCLIQPFLVSYTVVVAYTKAMQTTFYFKFDLYLAVSMFAPKHWSQEKLSIKKLLFDNL